MLGFVGFLRWALLGYSIYFDCVVFKKIDWTWQLLWASRFYLLFIAMILYIIWQTKRNLAKITNEHHQMRLLLVSGIFISVALYLAVTAFSYTIYRIIPSSRGGKLPAVAAVLQLSPAATAIYPDIMAKGKTGCTVSLYLMEQGEQYVYLMPEYNPFGLLDFTHIYVFKKEDVLAISYEPCDLRNKPPAAAK